LHIAHGIATYIILSGMSVVGASVQRPNYVIMCLLASNTSGGITIYIERSVTPTPMQPMLYSRCTMCKEDSMRFDVFPVL
jgi:hypothetical protein